MEAMKVIKERGNEPIERAKRIEKDAARWGLARNAIL